VKQLVIATWRIQTLPWIHDDQTIDFKIQQYRTKATAVMQQIDAEVARHGIPSPGRIFLAPEHLFRRSSTEMALHQDQKDRVIAAVKQISAQFGDAMIIPGTVVWREETAFAGFFNVRFEARNTAFVFQNGQILHQYNKHSDAGEITDAEKNHSKFRAGQKLGVFNSSAGTSVAASRICFDHSNSILLNQIRKKKESPVDVHLILSSTVTNKPGMIAARDGELVVHADGQDVKASHTPQVDRFVGAKTGIWDVQERALPRGGFVPASVAEDKKTNRGQYIDLNRRMSVTLRAGAAPAENPPVTFDGFDDDVSVYHVTLP
jgi:hypothetical protein